MAVRWYLVPKTGDGLSLETAFRPKYIAGIIAGRFAAMDYGKQSLMLVRADVTNAEHTAISGNADVVSAPANLDATIGVNLATVQAALESVNVPADWVTSGMKYRTVLRWVGRLFCLHQRFNGLSRHDLFEAGITLNSTIGSLTQAQRDRLTAAASSLSLDTSGISGTTTIRQALQIVANQLTLPIQLGTEAL